MFVNIAIEMSKFLWFLPFLVLVACTKKKTSTPVTQVINTIAGNGYRTGTSPSILGGYSGDGGLATAAELNNPAAIAVDANGNIYIADYDNSKIRKISSDGIITTFAEIGYPTGITIDANGNVYACSGTVYKITPTGIVTTIADVNGESIAIDSVGNIYAADENDRCVKKISSSNIVTVVAGNGTQGNSGDGGPATAAELFSPTGVAVDRFGNLYIADGVNNVVRKVNAVGIISTIAGTPYTIGGTGGFSGDGGPATAAKFNYAFSLSVDVNGNIYVADVGNNRIRKIDNSGIITTVAGNGTEGFSGDRGPAIYAELDGPDGVAIDASGNLYISDANNQHIRKVSK